MLHSSNRKETPGNVLHHIMNVLEAFYCLIREFEFKLTFGFNHNLQVTTHTYLNVRHLVQSDIVPGGVQCDAFGMLHYVMEGDQLDESASYGFL